ncbi:MAG: hypothetical protein EOO43_23165, partial [Flavobacterium sp.]
DIDQLRKMLSARPKGYYTGVIPVDFAGYPVNLEKIKQLATEYGLWIIEDACHAPGGYFNKEYESAILKDSVRFLAIMSHDYIKKASRDDSGVMNEILCARTVKDIKDFIIPIKYDDCSYDDFPVGIRGRDTINFSKNWAEGLSALVNHFEKIMVPKATPFQNIINFWYENQKIRPGAILKSEKYFTNYFEVAIPQEIQLYKLLSFENVSYNTLPIDFIREGDWLITFGKINPLDGVTYVDEATMSTDLFWNHQTLEVSDFLIKDPTRKLVRLINKCFGGFLRKRGLRVYNQSSNKEVFYFPNTPENRKMVNLKVFDKARRNVIGNTSDFVWHFAISFNTILNPIKALRISYHIVFTDSAGRLVDQDEQHELRRSLASTWYNR